MTAVIALSSFAVPACSQAAPAPDLTTQDIPYLTELRNGDVEFETADAALVGIRAGRGSCTSLDQSKGVPGAVKALLKEFYPDQASVIVVAAIHNYCPKHAGLLTLPGRN